MTNVRNPDGWFVNTEVFREEAKHFTKHGYYTEAPSGTEDFYNYWDEQLKRCIDGYTSGGVRITGHHYFYLNFCQIRAIDYSTRKKVKRFPDFWDMDYNYFHCLDIARNGISQDELKALQLCHNFNPLWLEGGKHLIVGKARRQGYTMKSAAVGANTYNSQRNSYVQFGAFEKKYIFGNKGTMTVCSQYLDFLNEHTAWAKKRDKVNQAEVKRASYLEEVNGVLVEKGFKSEIAGLSFKDNPSAGRGQDVDYLIMEEIGAWPGSKDAWMALKPSLEAGDITTGTGILYGTSGDMERGTQDFAEMFYNPEPYDLLPFENIWDDEAAVGVNCGFFCSTLVTKEGHIDPQGNSNVESALKVELANRERKKKGGGGLLHLYLQEFPIKPAEAFMVSNENDFPTKELREQLAKVRANGLYSKLGTPCSVSRSETGISLKPDLRGLLTPIDKFPLKKEDLSIIGLDGAVVVYEFPMTSKPAGLYKIGCDPYIQDQSTGPSLGAIYVYKSSNSFSFTRDMIVAEYIGRPKTSDDFNRILAMLAEAYNAKVMYENNVSDVASYFTREKKLDYLAFEPRSVIKANVKNSKVSRTYGCHMSPGLKDAAEKYIKRWLLTVRDYDEHGNEILNLHTIYSEGLLNELILFDRKKGNFDRVMAFAMVMFALEEEFGKTHEFNPEKKSRLDELAENLRATNGINYKSQTVAVGQEQRWKSLLQTGHRPVR